ncbi:hypothetical protein VTN02DRAFT_4956 [Thermoascus thermophilus]
MPRGWGVDGDDRPLLLAGEGKTKSSAIPPSEAAPMKGIVMRSAPRDISRRTSWGVLGSLKDMRGRSPSDSGMMDREADSYRASPAMCFRSSPSRSSKYSDCCVFSSGRTGAKYSVFDRSSSSSHSPYNWPVASLVYACVRSTIFSLLFTPGFCPGIRSARPTAISGRSLCTAST